MKKKRFTEVQIVRILQAETTTIEAAARQEGVHYRTEPQPVGRHPPLYNVEQHMVTPKRIYRLMKLHGLLVYPNLLLKASRVAHRRKPKPTAPNRLWGIDMTKVLIEGFGWVYVVLVLDWYTKKIVGHYAGI